MPSVCGACGRRCRCACRHRRKLCITSCSAARRQLARRRECDVCGAGVGVAGAVWRLVRPVWRRQVARHRVGVFRAASRRSSAATRTRGTGRAAIAASAVRTFSMIDSVDDAGSGAPSSAGRRLMRALASLASTSLWTSMCASDTAGRRRCAHPRRAHAGRSDRCSARRKPGALAPELEKERDARVAGALHTLTLLAGMPDIMLPTQRLQLLTMVWVARTAPIRSTGRLTRATPPTAEFATSSKKAKNIFPHDKC
jgi:hypothetical protein